jgi:hypothetical protein
MADIHARFSLWATAFLAGLRGPAAAAGKVKAVPFTVLTIQQRKLGDDWRLLRHRLGMGLRGLRNRLQATSGIVVAGIVLPQRLAVRTPSLAENIGLFAVDVAERMHELLQWAGVVLLTAVPLLWLHHYRGPRVPACVTAAPETNVPQ